MKLNKKALIFVGLELVALVFMYIDGYFTEQEVARCMMASGTSSEMCTPYFPANTWLFWGYAGFTWLAFTYLVSLIYKKWVEKKNATERIFFDIAMIPVVVLMPIILPLLWSIPFNLMFIYLPH